MNKAVHQFDKRWIATIQALPSWLTRPMTVVTDLGQPIVVIVMVLVVAMIAATERRHDMILACGSVLAAVVVCSILKLITRRKRPDTDYVKRLMYSSFSFPSGHAASALAGFGLLAHIALGFGGWFGVVLCVSLAVFGVLVGLSRIYLGAHYPSDVIGGWLIGALGLIGVFSFV